MRAALDIVRGTARIQACGPRPERMLNLFSQEGIWFSRTQRRDDTTIAFTVLHSDLNRTLQMARQAYFETQLLRHAGLPTLAHRVPEQYVGCKGRYQAPGGRI